MIQRINRRMVGLRRINRDFVEIRKGSRLLWAKDVSLDFADFQQVNYIAIGRNTSETGTFGYIDTGIKPEIGQTIRMKYRITSALTQSGGLMGARHDSEDHDRAFSIRANNNYMYYDFVAVSNSAVPSAVQTTGENFDIEVTLGENQVSYVLPGYNGYPRTKKFVPIEETYYLFTTNVGGAPMHCQPAMRIFSFSVEKDGELIQNLIPCYRKEDGVIGMFDSVTNRFFENQGDKAFTKGTDVI